MNPTPPLKTLASFAFGSLTLLAALSVTGCKKEEPPPPLPTAAPAATPEAALQLAPEDAGTPDADAEAPKGKGGGAPRSSLKKCCAALAQNAKSAPPPNDGFMLQAAAVCNGLAASGQDSAAAMGMIRGALKGVQLPAGCL